MLDEILDEFSTFVHFYPSNIHEMLVPIIHIFLFTDSYLQILITNVK